jgi:RND superfamily putative drug exporter
VARLNGSATEVRTGLAELSPRFVREYATIKVEVGGPDEVFWQVGAQARQDFIRAEMIIIPGVLLLLVLVYRRVVTAALVRWCSPGGK